MKTTFQWTCILALSALCFSACDDDDNDNNSNQNSCSSAEQVMCDNTCIDPMSNKSFCGADTTCKSYHVCDANQICLKGKCENITEIPSGETCTNADEIKCGTTCINPKTSDDYCGADQNCQNYDICGVNQKCIDGTCQSTTITDTCSGEGQVKCGTECINPMESKTFCGADKNCQNYKICTGDQYCEDGTCHDPNEENTCLIYTDVKCGETCINPLKSNEFCGADKKCQNYTACTGGKECVAGKCMSCFPFTDDSLKAYALETWDADHDGCTTETEFFAVTEIPSEAFKDNNEIKSFADLEKLPKLITIQSKAFMRSSATGKYTFSHVTEVGMAGFEDTHISELHLPEVTKAGSGAFYKSADLSKLEVPKLTELSNSLFWKCTGLTELELPAATNLNFSGPFKETGLTKLSLTAAGTIQTGDKTWDKLDTANCDLVLNADKQSGKTGSPTANGNSWAGATWKSIAFK